MGLLLAFCIPVLAKEKEPEWQRGKVVDQQLSSSVAGAYAAPVGTAAIAVPIYRQANDVVIETTKLQSSDDDAVVRQITYRYTWHEVGRKALIGSSYYPPKHPLILLVNSVIRFYRDGDLFVVMDSKNKPHNFIVTGMTELPIPRGNAN